MKEMNKIIPITDETDEVCEEHFVEGITKSPWKNISRFPIPTFYISQAQEI